MAAARSFDHGRIWSRDPEQARKLADELELPFPLEVVAHAEDAVRGADVVVTATAAETPIVQREWFGEGTHINAVGSSIPRTRELDGATVAASTLFVDRRESTENESGDFLLAVKEGTVSPDHITAELGEVFAGTHPGRTSPGEITLFKSLGIAMEDLAAGEYILRKAREQGVGSEVPF
jgi:ornithine cyclodeaminase